MLTKYNKIWDKIKDLFGKKFNSETVYGNKYIKTKIKSQITNFQCKEILIKGKNSTLFSIILLDSTVSVDKKYLSKDIIKNVNIK